MPLYKGTKYKGDRNLDHRSADVVLYNGIQIVLSNKSALLSKQVVSPSTTSPEIGYLSLYEYVFSFTESRKKFPL